MEYIFKTCVTMKEYNRNKWWIDNNIVKEYFIEADNVNQALTEYVKNVENDSYINISRNAVKNKSPMYIDRKDGSAKQIGYVITGSADFEKENYQGWSKQYIDLWVEIITTAETEFMEVA